MSGPGLKQVIERHKAKLLALSGVNGVAAGMAQAGGPCVVVYGTSKEAPSGLPGELDGYPVEYRRTGEFRARS